MQNRRRILLKIWLACSTFAWFGFSCVPPKTEWPTTKPTSQLQTVEEIPSATSTGGEQRVPSPALTPTDTKNLHVTRIHQPSLTFVPGLLPPAPPQLLSTGLAEGVRARFGDGKILHVALSPDGTLFVISGTKGLFLYRTASLERVWVLSTSDYVSNAIFSPDGTKIAAVLGDGFLYLLDAANGNLIDSVDAMESFRGKESELYNIGIYFEMHATENAPADNLSFSRDGKILAFGYYQEVLLLDLEDGSTTIVSSAAFESIQKVSISPDGQKIAVSTEGTILIWSINGEEILLSIDTQSDLILRLSWSPNSESLAAASKDGSAHVWDASTGELIQALYLEGSIRSLVFAPDGSRIAGGTAEGELLQWEVTQGYSQISEVETGFPILDISFLPEQDMLLLGSQSSVAIWDGVGGKLLEKTSEFDHPWLDADFLSTGKEEIAGTKESSGQNLQIDFIHIGNGKVLRTMNIPQGALLSPDFSKYASVSSQGDIQLTDAAIGRLLRTFGGPIPGGASLAFSWDGDLLAAFLNDRQNPTASITIWNTKTGDTIRGMDFNGQINGLAFSPDSKLLFVGDTYQGFIYDLTSGEEVDLPSGLDLRCHDGGPMYSSFSPDGKLILFVCGSHEVNVGNLETGEQKRFGQSGWEFVKYAITSDSRTLAVTYMEQNYRHRDYIEVRDIVSGENLRVLGGHHGSIRSLSFSSDGKILASVGKDGMLILWNV